ncbi:MAG: ATP-binding protein [Bosea sp. (in: a-proteobacteria)]|uniref:sensor histidine kinase n=1 Tax=Bosea sp. (in: a-proteobacteria) TaxID=1871050 RepID=UPI003F7BD16B
MTLTRLLRTTSFRFALFYALVFMGSVGILGAMVYLTVRTALEEQLAQRIDAEIETLAQDYRTQGLQHLIEAVTARTSARERDALEYSVVTPDNAVLAGRALPMPTADGWATITLSEKAKTSEEETASFYARTVTLDDGVRLSVANDIDWIDDVQEAILSTFAWALLATLILALASGLWLSARFLRGMDAMTRTAASIVAGNLKSRVPISSRNDDLDQLGRAFNSMLDRLDVLMDSLKQVSNDIAHDLRTPLSRLKQNLDETARGAATKDEMRTGILNATLQVDEILATFSALLRIAQIEAGTRRAGFAPVDLSELTMLLASDYMAVAEDRGQVIRTVVETSVWIEGDRDLLTQLIVNLLENALRHTPDGSEVTVALQKAPDGVTLWVADNGEGVPETERERIFRRFYRLEQSRTSPGSGLGLSLVAAIAELHGADLAALDNRPGLRVEVRFPSRTDG